VIKNAKEFFTTGWYTLGWYTNLRSVTWAETFKYFINEKGGSL